LPANLLKKKPQLAKHQANTAHLEPHPATGWL
jgi:hypothetical protein